MSVFFVRGTNGVHMVNTQTWHVTTLINLDEGGATFPDLSLLYIEAGEDHKLIVFTMDKGDRVLIRRTYSHMLKFCIQTACMRVSCEHPELRRKSLI